MAYNLKKVATHPTSKWTLYELLSDISTDYLATSPSDIEAEYKRLDRTRHESRKKAQVRRVNEVHAIEEQTGGDISF